MRLENMRSYNGNKVANQFIVEGELHGQPGLFFQSYNTVIAFKPGSGASPVLDAENWDYSTTTGKYRNQFLGENKKDTEKKIESGEYVLANLN